MTFQLSWRGAGERKECRFDLGIYMFIVWMVRGIPSKASGSSTIKQKSS